MTLRTVRTWLWGGVAATAGILVGALWSLPGTVSASVASTTSALPIGGEFALADQDGRPRTWADFRGRAVAVFFGFTHCPDICPTTLGEMSLLLADLGSRGDELQVVLVTGDPERDTPEVLNTYLQSFDPRITALTGSETEIERAFSTFKAYRKKVPMGDGYTIDHSAAVYLYDAAGAFSGTLDYHEDTATRRQKVDRLLDRPEGRTVERGGARG